MNSIHELGEQRRIDDPQSGSFFKLEPGAATVEAPVSAHIAAYDRYRDELRRTDTISFTELSYRRSIRASRIAVSAVMLEMISGKQLHDEIDRRLRDGGSVAIVEAARITDIPRDLFLLLSPERIEELSWQAARDQRSNVCTNLGETLLREGLAQREASALEDVREQLAAEPSRRAA